MGLRHLSEASVCCIGRFLNRRGNSCVFAVAVEEIESIWEIKVKINENDATTPHQRRFSSVQSEMKSSKQGL